MRFKVEYTPIRLPTLPIYWRTVDADNLTEATRIANGYARKGYRVAQVIQDTDSKL